MFSCVYKYETRLNRFYFCLSFYLCFFFCLCTQLILIHGSINGDIYQWGALCSIIILTRLSNYLYSREPNFINDVFWSRIIDFCWKSSWRKSLLHSYGVWRNKVAILIENRTMTIAIIVNWTCDFDFCLHGKQNINNLIKQPIVIYLPHRWSVTQN